MSIRDVICRHEGVELHCLVPRIGGEETPRTVLVSSEVLEIVNPPWPPTREGRVYASLRGLLDSFTEGGLITVAEDPFDKDATAMLARVHPVSEEVWDFRCLDPNPGIRAFGSFTEIDTFVVLTWYDRDNIDWTEEVTYCKQQWKRLFGELTPLSGRGLNEYITYNYRSV